MIQRSTRRRAVGRAGEAGGAGDKGDHKDNVADDEKEEDGDVAADGEEGLHVKVSELEQDPPNSGYRSET